MWFVACQNAKAWLEFAIKKPPVIQLGVLVLNYPLALYTYIQRNSDCDSNRARKICNGNESLAFYYAQWEKMRNIRRNSILAICQ